MAVSRSKLFELELQRELTLDRVEVILSESPPALRDKVTWIRATFDDEWRRSIVARYQVAVVIREIYEDVTENKGSVYGAKAVEAIKKALAWDDAVIYQALHVADAFTPEQVEAMTRMRLPGGRPLSFSHLAALSRVEEERHREKLLKRAVKEGWTARQLTNAADEAGARPADAPEERRGRPLARPRTFDAVLGQQAGFAEDFLNRNEQVWSQAGHSLSAKAEDLDSADFTPERAERLERHAAQLSLLAEKAKERADEAGHVHTLFVRVLREKAGRLKNLGSPVPP
jgi:hypothetical protein